MNVAVRHLGIFLCFVLVSLFGPPAVFAYDIPAYSGPWAAMHRDNRNSDYAPIPIPASFTSGFLRRNFHQIAYNKPVIGPNNGVYYSYTGTGPNGYSQYYIGIDGSTGAGLFILGYPDVDDMITAQSGVIGDGGDLFICDNEGVMRYSPRGVRRWAREARIYGVQPSGLQFTPDGKILVMTWKGWIHVIEPADGTILWERNMTPGRRYPDRPGG